MHINAGIHNNTNNTCLFLIKCANLGTRVSSDEKRQLLQISTIRNVQRISKRIQEKGT